MSKYDRLGEYLKRQRRDLVPMTFSEVEAVTGVKLPTSAHKHRPWWSNNPDHHVIAKVWFEAGFVSEQVDLRGRKLVFRRMRKPAVASGEKPFHPAYGFMQGLVRITPGTDLTQPADPEWADRLDAEYGPGKREQ